MHFLITVKTVLDTMDGLGDMGYLESSKRAATMLNLKPTAPELTLAIEYCKYELRCLGDGARPLRLGQWYREVNKLAKAGENAKTVSY